MPVHLLIWQARPVHVPPVPGMPGQTPACAPVPQAIPPGHDGQSSTPPQPLPNGAQERAAPPDVEVIGAQPGTAVQEPAVQTPSALQAPHSIEPPLQPLPILPQYWPPAGAQVTDGVQAASLPASTEMIGPPPVPAVALVPAAPAEPAAPVEPPEPGPAPAPPVPAVALTPAEQPSDAARTAPR